MLWSFRFESSTSLQFYSFLIYFIEYILEYLMSESQLQPCYTLCQVTENYRHDKGLIHSGKRTGLVKSTNSTCQKKGPGLKKQNSHESTCEKRQIYLSILASKSLNKHEIKKRISVETIQQKESIDKNKWFKTTLTMMRRKKEKDCSKSQKKPKVEDEDGSCNWPEEVPKEPGYYTFTCLPSSLDRRKSENWYSQFMNKQSHSETKEVVSTEDSFEIIDQQTPGPNHYQSSIHHSRSTLNAQNFFGSSERFPKHRPITADTQFVDGQNFLKKRNGNQLEDIRFGTSIKNLKSEVRKVNYCDWYRSHCCEKDYDLASQSKKKSVRKFQSHAERFPLSQKNYYGPDFYCKEKESLKEKQNLPSYYFISEVEKGIFLKKKDGIPEEKQIKSSEGKMNRKIIKANIKQQKERMEEITSLFIEQQCYGEENIKNQIEDQVPKNSIGSRNRKKKVYHPMFEKKKQAIVNDSEGFVELNENKKIQAMENLWAKKSFNVKFEDSVKSS